MTRETQWSTFLLCVGVAALAFLINVSSAAAQGDDNTNGQSNNARGDDDRNVFAVRQGPGTNTGNCPAPPPPTDGVVFPKVYCPYPPGIIPRDLTYLDRVNISLAAPSITAELRLSPTELEVRPTSGLSAELL
jgi:hypothetical protein